jgi:hypothetical protein
MNFSLIDLRITVDHLGHDGMHVDPQHQSVLSNAIQNHFDDLIRKRTNSDKPKRRSRVALTRRNKKTTPEITGKTKNTYHYSINRSHVEIKRPKRISET